MCKHCIAKARPGSNNQVRKFLYCKLAEEKGIVMRCKVEGKSELCKKGEEE